MNINLPADPRVLSGHRQAARGGLATALPKFLRRALAPLYGNPAAIELHRKARFEADCLRTVRNAIAKARPADGGASTSLAQPVPYHALHGETGEGFETRRVALRPAGRRHCHSRTRLSDADPRNRHHHAHGLTHGPCAVCHLAHHWSRDGNRVRRVHNLSSPGFLATAPHWRPPSPTV